jgi:hypothetical protein
METPQHVLLAFAEALIRMNRAREAATGLRLPAELMSEVASYLDGKSLCNLRLGSNMETRKQTEYAFVSAYRRTAYTLLTVATRESTSLQAGS